jgi:hypothetical protein
VFALRRRRLGQALSEFALVIPLVVMLGTGISTYWLAYQHQAAYATAAFSMGEWISRSGAYTAAMQEATVGSIDSAFGVGSGNAVLYIEAIAPDGTTFTIGTPPPAQIDGSNSGDPVLPPARGWDETSELTALPPGTRLHVAIWTYRRLTVPFVPIPGDWRVATSIAEFRVIGGSQ